MPFLPFIPFVDCVEWLLRGSLQGVPCLITGAVKAPGAVTPTTLSDVADVIDAWWGTDLIGWVSAVLTVQDVKCTDLTTAVGPTFTKPITGSGTGTGGSGANGGQVAAVVSLRTAKRGRSYRGRVYIPGVPSSFLGSANSLSSTARAALTTVWANLYFNLAAASFTPQVLSRQENNVRRTIGVATPINNFTVNLILGTQRRRLV